MSRTVVLMRHLPFVYDVERMREDGPWFHDAPVTDDAASQVKTFCETHINARSWKYLAHSPFRRARETAELVMPNGEWDEAPQLAPRLWRVHEALYFALDNETAEVDRLPMMEQRWPELFTVEREWVVRTMELVLRKLLQNGERALLVSHSPLTSYALDYYAAECEVRSSWANHKLKQGEAYEFTFPDDSGSPCMNIEHLT